MEKNKRFLESLLGNLSKLQKRPKVSKHDIEKAWTKIFGKGLFWKLRLQLWMLMFHAYEVGGSYGNNDFRLEEVEPNVFEVRVYAHINTYS